MSKPSKEVHARYRNSAHGAAKRKARVAAAAKRNKDIVNKLRDAPCLDCGGVFPSVVMQFDHVRGKKTSQVSTVAGTGVTVETLMKEIAKCEVVCANCHAIRTAARRNKGE